jgi:two-component system, chemotaxis family, chemotaxis protein CheY
MASPLIMVIDDDAAVRSALSDLLEEEGYRVVAIADGREGLRHLSRQEQPILLDLMMPAADGWQFRAEQLMNPALASIPVIVVTALPASNATRPLGLEVVGKPFDTRRLLSLVRRYCPNSLPEPVPDEAVAVASIRTAG